MAENENGQEKTEQPTAKKLQDAKKKGQVPRSVDFNTTMMTMLGSLALLVLSPDILNSVYDMLRHSFILEKERLFDDTIITLKFRSVFLDFLQSLSPFLFLMLIVAIVPSGLLGGWVFSFENIRPKLGKMNPLKGLARIFSAKGVMELVKSLLKVLLVGIIGFLLFLHLFDHFISFALKPLMPSIVFMSQSLLWGVLTLGCGMVFVAIIDVPFQIAQHKKNLRMTRQEVKDEMRDTDGKPEVKSRIRQLQQQAANARMMDEVPNADVVITNPTHYAVALRYQQETMDAPVLIAKGVGLIALRIREISEESGVVQVESPALARAIYASTDLNQEIPSALYIAVAQILGFVFQLRTAQKNGTAKPSKPKPRVPRDFLDKYDIKVDSSGNVIET